MTETIQEAVIENWLPRNHGNSRDHWAAKHRRAKAEQALAFWTAREAGWRKVTGLAELEIVFVTSSARYVNDDDNAFSRAKNLADGLKGYWFEDDDPAHLRLKVRTEVQRGRKAVVLRLRKVEEA